MFGSGNMHVSANLPFPLCSSFLVYSASLFKIYKPYTQFIFDLHMQQVKIFPIRYIINKKVLEKYY